MSTIKELRIEPLTAGAPITWTHFTITGEQVERTGTVWDRGPAVDGALVVCWVVPNEPLSGDLYAAIPVGKATRHQAAHGNHRVPQLYEPQVAKQDLFSSDDPESALGVLAITAARCAQRERQAATS